MWAGGMGPGWAWCGAASACSLRLVGGRCGWAGAQTREPRLPGTWLLEAYPPSVTPVGCRGQVRWAWGPVWRAGQGEKGTGHGPRVGLTWAGPGRSCVCSQRSSSRATQASSEGPRPLQPRLASSMSRRVASGSSRVANPFQASSRSCGDTRPHCGEPSPPALPPEWSCPPSLPAAPSRRMAPQRPGLIPGPEAGWHPLHPDHLRGMHGTWQWA